MSSKKSKSNYERRPEVRLKRYIKNKDPDYISKRTEYSLQPGVKQRRKTLNQRRRQLCTILINMVKNGLMYDDEGNIYLTEAGRLIKKGNKIVKCDKLGNVHCIEFDTRIDLEKEELDEPIMTEEDEKFKELLEKYKKGEIQVTKKQKNC